MTFLKAGKHVFRHSSDSSCASPLGQFWVTEIVKTTSALKRLTVWWTRQTFTRRAKLNMTRAIMEICRQCHGPERRSMCRVGEGCQQGGCRQPCGPCSAHLAAVHGEALDAGIQSPLKTGNTCTGEKGRLQVGWGKEGVHGEAGGGNNKYSRWKIRDTVNALEQTHHWGKGVGGHRKEAESQVRLFTTWTLSFSWQWRVNESFKTLKVTHSFKG